MRVAGGWPASVVGIRNLAFHGYARNQAWLLAANLASDLTRLIPGQTPRDKRRARGCDSIQPNPQAKR